MASADLCHPNSVIYPPCGTSFSGIMPLPPIPPELRLGRTVVVGSEWQPAQRPYPARARSAACSGQPRSQLQPPQRGHSVGTGPAAHIDQPPISTTTTSAGPSRPSWEIWPPCRELPWVAQHPAPGPLAGYPGVFAELFSPAWRRAALSRDGCSRSQRRISSVLRPPPQPPCCGYLDLSSNLLAVPSARAAQLTASTFWTWPATGSSGAIPLALSAWVTTGKPGPQPAGRPRVPGHRGHPNRTAADVQLASAWNSAI